MSILQKVKGLLADSKSALGSRIHLLLETTTELTTQTPGPQQESTNKPLSLYHESNGRS
jgi:hypothetical protein